MNIENKEQIIHRASIGDDILVLYDLKLENIAVVNSEDLDDTELVLVKETDKEFTPALIDSDLGSLMPHEKISIQSDEITSEIEHKQEVDEIKKLTDFTVFVARKDFIIVYNRDILLAISSCTDDEVAFDLLVGDLNNIREIEKVFAKQNKIIHIL